VTPGKWTRVESTYDNALIDHDAAFTLDQKVPEVYPSVACDVIAAMLEYVNMANMAAMTLSSHSLKNDCNPGINRKLPLPECFGKFFSFRFLFS
jgi:hypothetical protein